MSLNYCINREKALHMRAKHSAIQNQRQERVEKKVRWAKEESTMMARKEAQLATTDLLQFMNIALQAIFDNRTTDSIKRVQRSRCQVLRGVCHYASRSSCFSQPSDHHRGRPPKEAAGPLDVTPFQPEHLLNPPGPSEDLPEPQADGKIRWTREEWPERKLNLHLQSDHGL